MSGVGTRAAKGKAVGAVGRPAYPEYKESGIEWLGDIPEQWAWKRLKFAVTLVNEKIESVDTGLTCFGLENIESWTGRKVETESKPDGIANLFKKGDVLFGKLRPYLAKVYHAKSEEGLCTAEALVLREKDFLPRYLFYYLLSKDFINIVDSSTYGSKMPRASWDFIGKLPALLPAPEEQAAIASFLDRETARIDALIAKKQRLVELLQEKHTALISQAVTKGLDPGAPMKDSGVEWLGEVPPHWEVPPLYARYVVQLGKMLDEKRITGKNLVPYLRNVDVRWDFVCIDNLPEMDIEPAQHERFTLKAGDMLVCEGGEVGRTAFWRGELALCGFQKALHRLRPCDPNRDLPRFLYYVFYMAAKDGVFIAGGNPNTIPHLTGEKLRVYRFPFPPYEEQEKIVAFLDHETTKLDTLRTKVEAAIEKLKEYRAALISAAVTGKIDVRVIGERREVA